MYATDGRSTADSDAELAALHAFAAAMHRWRVGLAGRYGLTLTDTMVLTTLVRSVDAGAPPVTAATLANAVGIASGRLTGSLDRLEAAGLARRVPNPTDRRSVLVGPTEDGRRVDAVLDGALRAVVADASGAPFRRRFTARLVRLTGAAEQARTAVDGGR